MLEFGFDAHKLDFSTDQVKIYTLPSLKEKAKQAEESADTIIANNFLVLFLDWLHCALPEKI